MEKNMKKTVKKLLSFSLVLALALSLGSVALAEESHSPDDGFATRGDVIKELYWDYGADDPIEAAEVFSDVTADSGLADAAAWAVARGIAKGYGDGTFGPDDLVTREQAITLLYRYVQTLGMGLQGLWMFQLDYADAAEVSEWADEAIHWAVGNQVLTERDSGLLEPKGFIGINELPVLVRNMEDAITLRAENDGCRLNVPKNISELLQIATPEQAEDGTLFSVSEQASIDAAKAKGYEEDSGMGWLFSIRRVSEEEAHQLLCADMSGMKIFAKDGEDNYYIFCTPTDVRYDRETTEQMIADQDQWSALNEWAWTVPESFASDNGFTPVRYGNTDFEIALNRVAYDPNVKYTLSTTAYGPLEPDATVDAAAYALNALDGASFANEDRAEAPDGEYVVLNFPEEGQRFDVFSADGNLIRRVTDWGEYYMRATYEDEGVKLFDVLQEWYFALAAAHGLGSN